MPTHLAPRGCVLPAPPPTTAPGTGGCGTGRGRDRPVATGRRDGVDDVGPPRRRPCPVGRRGTRGRAGGSGRRARARRGARRTRAARVAPNRSLDRSIVARASRVETGTGGVVISRISFTARAFSARIPRRARGVVDLTFHRARRASRVDARARRRARVYETPFRASRASRASSRPSSRG